MLLQHTFLFTRKIYPVFQSTALLTHIVTSRMGMMRHVIAVVRIAASAAAIISLWRGYAAYCCCYATASALPRPKFCIFFNTKTLLVLQFVIEFANIWTQYCSLSCASTHIGFFLICALMSKWQAWQTGNRRNFAYFWPYSQSMGARGSKKAYTRARTGMCLHTIFGCDWSIVVGCRNDRQTYR